MSKVEAVWTGEFPRLCEGEWRLFIDGVEYSDSIPEERRYDPMYTFCTRLHWFFSDDYDEEWETVTNGKPEKEWIKENASWLGNIPADPVEIYNAFQKSDFRLHSCGGCI